MKTFPFAEFKSIVVETAMELTSQGYQLTHAFPPELSVSYLKALDQTTVCEVSFQLLPYIDPFGFKVNLYRRPASEDAISRYCSLGIDLRNLMLGFYEKNPFPSGVFYWEFTDNQSLVSQLTRVQSILIDYGVKWLEDPSSNIDWVKKKQNA